MLDQKMIGKLKKIVDQYIKHKTPEGSEDESPVLEIDPYNLKAFLDSGPVMKLTKNEKNFAKQLFKEQMKFKEYKTKFEGDGNLEFKYQSENYLKYREIQDAEDR